MSKRLRWVCLTLFLLCGFTITPLAAACPQSYLSQDTDSGADDLQAETASAGLGSGNLSTIINEICQKTTFDSTYISIKHNIQLLPEECKMQYAFDTADSDDYRDFVTQALLANKPENIKSLDDRIDAHVAAKKPNASKKEQRLYRSQVRSSIVKSSQFQKYNDTIYPTLPPVVSQFVIDTIRLKIANDVQHCIEMEQKEQKEREEQRSNLCAAGSLCAADSGVDHNLPDAEYNAGVAGRTVGYKWGYFLAYMGYMRYEPDQYTDFKLVPYYNYKSEDEKRVYRCFCEYFYNGFNAGKEHAELERIRGNQDEIKELLNEVNENTKMIRDTVYEMADNSDPRPGDVTYKVLAIALSFGRFFV